MNSPIYWITTEGCMGLDWWIWDEFSYILDYYRGLYDYRMADKGQYLHSILHSLPSSMHQFEGLPARNLIQNPCRESIQIHHSSPIHPSPIT